jgi:hypothetical protein
MKRDIYDARLLVDMKRDIYDARLLVDMHGCYQSYTSEPNSPPSIHVMHLRFHYTT